jgi:uncharacterized SAM-binding protein YcdF (DUF218 family)
MMLPFLPSYPLAAVAADLNAVAAFLALGDGAGRPPAADVLILLGNSVLATAERAFALIRDGAAPRILIVGGRGHSTIFLERSLQATPRYAAIPTAGRSEAAMLADMAQICGVPAARMLIEPSSRNCGENAAFARGVLDERGVRAFRVLLMQDPTMQRRIDATFRHVWNAAGAATVFANDPTFVPRLSASVSGLTFAEPVAGCWEVERFVSLVLGEIPRLRDDADGYGPAGRGLIAHVDIPEPVAAAHARLASAYPALVRPPWGGEPSSR